MAEMNLGGMKLPPLGYLLRAQAQAKAMEGSSWEVFWGEAYGSTCALVDEVATGRRQGLGLRIVYRTLTGPADERLALLSILRMHWMLGYAAALDDLAQERIAL